MREGEKEESSSVCVLNVGVDQLTEELEKTGLWVWWDCSGNGIWWKGLWDICLCVCVTHVTVRDVWRGDGQEGLEDVI